MATHPANIVLQAICIITYVGISIAVLVHIYRLTRAKVSAVRKQIGALLLVYTLTVVITMVDPFYIYGIFPNQFRDLVTLIRVLIVTVVICLWVYSAIASGYALSMKPEPVLLKRVFFAWFLLVIFLAIVGGIVRKQTNNSVILRIVVFLFAVNLLIWFFVAWYHFRRIVNYLAERARESEHNSNPSSNARMLTSTEIRKKAYGMCITLLLLAVVALAVGVSNLRSEQSYNNTSNDPSLLHPLPIGILFGSIFVIVAILYNYWVPRSSLRSIADPTASQGASSPSSPSSKHSRKSYTSNHETVESV